MSFKVSILYMVSLSCIVDSYKTVIPYLDSEWWGPADMKYRNDTSIRPFSIHFDSEMVHDLRYRLLNHRPYTPPLEGVGFEYGFNTDAIHGWVDYWANDYNFQEREDFLNQYPQFKTQIQGLDIHFLWIRPRVPPHVKVIPLLMIHGFPGSVVEFYKAIPLLLAPSNNRNFAIELIIPSLPGFAYSDPAVRPGLGASEMGVVLKNLMNRLGFQRFYVQGGDWGSYVGLTMATIYPKEVLGFHSNLAVAFNRKVFGLYLLGAIHPSLVMNPAVADRIYPLLDQFLFILREFGYFHIQASKPDTPGVAIADSPAGLLAYIFQLFSSATRRKFVYRPDGGLQDFYTPDELLDNLMMYWAPNTFTTAARIYAETFNLRNLQMGMLSIPTDVPTWTIHAKDEILYQPPSMLKTKYVNLLHSTILQGSGHFLAFESPKIFANDVLNALVAFEKWHSRTIY